MPFTMQLVLVVLLSSSTIMFSQAHPGFGYGFGWPGYNNGGGGGGGGGGVGGSSGGGGGGGGGGSYDSLSPNFYDFSCPQANGIITSVLEEAIAQDPRMAASLLRLHFHDCFVQGCDASLLLDDSSTIKSEKKAKPNAHFLRGFKVIDEIKARLEKACPETVSCADILALAARGSTVLSGGPNWELPLGRRDSLTASLKLATLNIPAPNFTISQLVQSFEHVGLDETDLVALSGAHTIGMARCKSFKQRLYTKNGNPLEVTLARDRTFLYELRSVCPSSGGDRNLSPMDYATPRAFDNTYYKLVLEGRGLLFTDEALVAGKVPNIVALVKAYAQDEALFFSHFAKSIVKMGETSPLLGSNGQIRKNCRFLN